MRFDLISVFPEFFDVLKLSLVGKAREHGLLDIHAHNLRDWTTDPHRTVDDTPAGGGAGMVMRPDIWGRAIDTVLQAGSGRQVLAIPTPSGTPLTQRACEDLSHADQVIVACGRYEGIDARVAQHYAGQAEVFEFSLGDYVLNGGEIAAIALVEAVGRLIPGMVGNAQSLVEESFSEAGLLEYPVYTRPEEWRGLTIPAVLTSGDHGVARRWRRDRALDRTAERRPEMIAALDAATLDKKDRRYLTSLGYLVPKSAPHPERAEVRPASASDAPTLAALAARTFPDACPPAMSPASIAAFINEHLSERAFAEYLADLRWVTTVLISDGHPVGYTLALLPEGSGVAGVKDGAPDGVVERDGPLVELSKVYVDRAYRGTGATAWLMDVTLARLAEATSDYPRPVVWLGTNAGNRRAQHAYRKAGFEKVTTREFLVGEERNSDVVMARPLRVA